MRGKRGGDIGCESEPVSQFFQLHADECKGNEFSVATNTFLLQSKAATIAGIFPPEFKITNCRRDEMEFSGRVVCLNRFKNRNFLSSSAKLNCKTISRIFLALEQMNDDAKVFERRRFASTIFRTAENHRREIAGQVIVETPDAFINAAVPALNIAANAIWEDAAKIVHARRGRVARAIARLARAICGR